MIPRFRSFLIVTAALCALATSSALAQGAFDCSCKYVTVNIDPGVLCKFTLCIATPASDQCITVAPGSSFRVECHAGLAVSLRDCHGNDIPIVPGRDCQRGIGAGPNCCTVDICTTKDANGCLVINITPSILDVCPCL